ncbi:hypothetical protein ACFX2I_013544 [Malus domestica]
MIKVNPNTANANTIPTCEPRRFKSSGSDDKNGKVLTGEIVLMDASGETLLTTRRKRLSLGDNWVVYDKETEVTPRLRATKHVNILKNKCLTHMTSVNNRSANRLKVLIQNRLRLTLALRNQVRKSNSNGRYYDLQKGRPIGHRVEDRIIKFRRVRWCFEKMSLSVEYRHLECKLTSQLIKSNGKWLFLVDLEYFETTIRPTRKAKIKNVRRYDADHNVLKVTDTGWASR